jgi:hypothetical protein
MKIEKTFTLNAPVDEVMNAVRDRSVIEENEKSRGALDVKIEDLSSDENKHVYRVAATNHLRTKTGGLDKSKTEINTVINEWDLKAKSCRWNWQGTNPNASRVKLSGGTTLRSNGANTDMTMVADVEVSIPVLGKTISKKIGEGFADEWPKYIAQLKKRLGG